MTCSARIWLTLATTVLSSQHGFIAARPAGTSQPAMTTVPTARQGRRNTPRNAILPLRPLNPTWPTTTRKVRSTHSRSDRQTDAPTRREAVPPVPLSPTVAPLPTATRRECIALLGAAGCAYPKKGVPTPGAIPAPPQAPMRRQHGMTPVLQQFPLH